MLLTQINPSAESRFSWFNYERRNWIGAVILAAFAGFSVGNGHTTQGAVQDVSDQLGKSKAQIKVLKSAAHCEDNRAKKAADVAQKAIVGAIVPAAPIPSPAEIPADNCPHPGLK